MRVICTMLACIGALAGCQPIRAGDRVLNLEDGRPADVADERQPTVILVITCNLQGDPTAFVSEAWPRWQTERVSGPQYDLAARCEDWAAQHQAGSVQLR